MVFNVKTSASLAATVTAVNKDGSFAIKYEGGVAFSKCLPENMTPWTKQSKKKKK